ncbi:integrin alpha-X isoform X2 [Acinonyx jubatus]|uniref:Integrin alpha-X isoform X2 n=1 Tax=Acinonyx jubatus TaxID=32536 RepID=A0ABM3PBU3_ACIJB|nr:integrin alpha-X isoform X2 [Acinonyx jubatus]
MLTTSLSASILLTTSLLTGPSVPLSSSLSGRGTQKPISYLPVMTMIRTFLLLMGLASSLCFNLDPDQPTTFLMESAGFGYSVVQYANSWVVVGAPQEIKAANQTGSLYQCDYRTGKCEPIRLKIPPEAVNMSLGLSLAASTNPSQLLACGPTVHHTCKENMYLTGFCFLLVSPSWQAQRLPAALQECPRQEQDIVFLIDGSGSISFRDFTKMLNFVKAVMSQFQRPSTQFSLMQFSHHSWVHFTFKDFIYSSNPLGLLDSVQQLRGFTYTATAIQMVTNQLFSASSGARKDASKILIVITDGQKQGDPLGYEDVIPRAEAAGIIRYAVGVGLAFQNPHSRKELNDIASKPSHEHIFQVENFDALRDIQNQLKEKIFAIEGTQTISSSSFELEMSQEGFSAVFSPDGPVLGAVGSFSWSGGAFLYPQNMSPTFINMSQENVDMRDSYLGYSTELALWKGVKILILGAPRHQHTGKVVIFTQASGQWRPKAEVAGTQIGSYFGASLCSVDVNRDGNSDLVLIGAPHYYKPTRGGQVSMCHLPLGRARWQCEVILCGEQGHPWGRFGAALTVLGDVNGDKLTDVAIGAPGEQENRGAVYLFHGTSELGISPSHSQNQLQAHSPSLTCDGTPAQGQSTQSTRCSINHLIFHEGAKMTFMVTFDVSPKAILGDRLLLTANVSSENTTPRTSKTTFQMELMVKYAIYTVISSHEESTKYLNFSALDWEESSQAQHRYQVNNLGQRDLPVSINFSVPVELNGVPVWTELGVFHPQNPSIQCSSERMVPIESDFLTHIQKNPVLNCSIADCLRFHCDLPSFGVQEELDFILKGNLSFGWVSQTLQKKVLIVSVAEIMFNTSVYAQLPGQEAFLRAQMEMVLEKYEVYNTVPIIVGSSLGGLLLLALITVILYKVGFFKRQYKEMMEEANGQTIPENGTSDPQASQ